jgi:hypothetical protein
MVPFSRDVIEPNRPIIIRPRIYIINVYDGGANASIEEFLEIL